MSPKKFIIYCLGAPVPEYFHFAHAHRLHHIGYDVVLDALEKIVQVKRGIHLDYFGEHLAHLGRFEHAPEQGGKLFCQSPRRSGDRIVRFVVLGFELEKLFNKQKENLI